MKRIPNQHSELQRFRGELRIISELRGENQNVLDDGIFGYALARADVYTFRGEIPDLEARIAAERQKPPSNQGARTAARDGRRTLELLGFLDSDAQLTDTGTLLLQSVPGSPEEITLWRQATIAMRLADSDDSMSHPMRILLRLLADRGPIARIELALALEAKDDGQSEYDRILALVPIRSAIDRGALTVTSNNLANAVKILPALALQLGLAVDLGDDRLQIAEAGKELYKSDFQFGNVSPPVVVWEVGQRLARRRRAGTTRRRILRGESPVFDPTLLSTLSPEEQIEAARLRSERTRRHEEVVNQVAAAFAPDFTVEEDPLSFDALLVPHEPAENYFVLEIKTLDLDEVDQTNRAVAQLLWYSWAIVSPMYEGRAPLIGVVYDRAPTEETCRYLQSLSIGAFSCFELQITACNEAARTLCPTPIAVPDERV